MPEGTEVLWRKWQRQRMHVEASGGAAGGEPASAVEAVGRRPGGLTNWVSIEWDAYVFADTHTILK